MSRTARILVVFDIVALLVVGPAMAQDRWPQETPPPPLLAPNVEFPDYEL